MLREILGILFLNSIVKILNARELALGEELHLLGPDDGDTHILSGIRHDGTCQVVWVDSHETFLVEAEISEKFRVFLEMRSQIRVWLVPWLLIFCISEDLFIFEEAPL